MVYDLGRCFWGAQKKKLVVFWKTENGVSLLGKSDDTIDLCVSSVFI
jgi:hypothetical protein